MKPKLLHQEAMDYSFQAKSAMNSGEFPKAFELYIKAANLESQVAEFYMQKPELEPTRSIIIRSAAFLNLKAGLIEKAQEFIFFGLLNTQNVEIKNQLNDALELAVALRNLNQESASGEFNYLNLLRQRSINYSLEPVLDNFGHSVTLEMIKDFSESYLKSLKSFAIAQYKRVLDIRDEIHEIMHKEIDKLTNPVVTNSGYGSFKFSIANDFLGRVGETKEVVQLKSTIISKYHNEIFTNTLDDKEIAIIKQNYSEDEINDIFRPLTKIKSNRSSYKVGYYDPDNFNKNYVRRIVNKQRKQLLSIRQLSQEDIGELESSIIHKRSSADGKVTRKTIFKEDLKSYEIDIKTNQIEPDNIAPLLLSDEIVINMNFSSDKGFTFSFDDFRIENTDIEHGKALKGFYNLFYNKILVLAQKKVLDEYEQRDWDVIKNLIGDTDALI
jgi:hypothetical protein